MSNERSTETEGSRPLFITIDGPKGVGKSTIAHGLEKLLLPTHRDILMTHEPTDSTLGHFCRRAEDSFRGKAFACLVAADRHYHVTTVISPALDRGTTVVSERYIESSLVLQHQDGVSFDFIWNIHEDLRRPDLSILLTATPSTLENRLIARNIPLGRIAQSISRADELGLYQRAAAFLRTKSFNVFEIENEKPVDEVSKDLARVVASLR